MSYDLLPATDTRLNTISTAVPEAEINGGHIRNIVSAMSRIAIGERSPEHPELPSLVGLAAPQIGAFERIILFEENASAGTANFDVSLRFIINPVITWASSQEELGREGCYSAGNIGGAVFRARNMTVTGKDETNNAISYELSGFLARIVQHEIDHLNGIRFPERVRRPEHLHALDFKSDEFQTYREDGKTGRNYYHILIGS